MPQFSKSKTWATDESPIASADMNSLGNDIVAFLNVTKLDSDNIQDLGITAGKLSGSIPGSKLATTTAGHVLLGTTTTGVPTFTAITGDVTVTGGGVTAIGNNKITNAMLGDGVVDTAELAAGAVETAKIEDLNVTAGKLAADSVETAKIKNANVTGVKIATGAIVPNHLLASASTNNNWTWDSYTPTWTNITVGNGTSTGKYIKIGKTVIFKASFVFGSSSSAASSPISVSVPVTATALQGTTLVDSLMSECTYYDQSGGIVLSGFLRWVDTGNVRLTARTLSGANILSSSLQGNTPIAFTNLDELHVMGTYEAA